MHRTDITCRIPGMSTRRLKRVLETYWWASRAMDNPRAQRNQLYMQTYCELTRRGVDVEAYLKQRGLIK